MKKIIILMIVLNACFISCVDRYDTHWVPIKSYKCYVIWNDNRFNLQCKTNQGDVFNIEMRHHHYYQSELRKYLYVYAPCEIYVFQDTITKDCYYRLYKYNDYEAHTLSIVKIK